MSKRIRCTRVAIEGLEPRQLLASVDPTSYEVYAWQLVNRARLNPQAEASRYGISISNSPVQPLAISFQLTDAARKHSQWMQNTGTFSHNEGSVGPGTRMSNAGYVFSGSYGWGENIFWSSGTTLSQGMIDSSHSALFKSSGHRSNMLNGSYDSLGEGAVNGSRGTYVTEDYAYTSASGYNLGYATGVVINDKDGDKFYDVGEGLGSVKLSFKHTSDGKVYTTDTTPSGAYRLNIPSGAYVLTVTGGGLGTKKITKNFTMGSANQQFNFRSQDAVAAVAAATSPATASGTTFSTKRITSDLLG